MGWHKVPLYMVFMHGGKKKEISTIWISKAKNLSNVTIFKSAIIFKEKLPRHRILTPLKKNVYITLLPGYVMSNPEFFTLLSKSKSSRLGCVSDLIETGFDCIHSRLCTFCTETILKQTPSNKLFKTSAAKAEAVNEGLFTSSICSIITIYRIWRAFIKQDLTTSCKFNSLLVVKSNQNTFQI